MRTRRAPAFRAGYGEIDLEAPLGGSMPGYFKDRKATGTLDPLMARALYLEDDKTRGVVISLDLIGVADVTVKAIRDEVSGKTGMDPQNIWVHGTHAHTGTMVPRSFTSDARDILAEIYIGEVDPDWTNALPGRVSSAVAQAVKSASPTDVQLGQDQAQGVAFYRRFFMKDGTFRTNPGRGNPNIDRPAGEIDPTVTVYRFPGSKSLLVIFGVHPDVVGGHQYSADYPAHLVARLRDQYGPDWGVLFLNAACGDINHVDVSNPNQKKGVEESTRIGRTIAEGAIRAIKKAETLMDTTLEFASQTVDSPIRHVPEAVFEEAERVLHEETGRARAFNGLYAPAAFVLAKTKDKTQPAEISALRLGPSALVGMPGEIFVELARLLQHDSPFDPTRLIGLTNGSLGYIPHEEGYKQGGYEAGYRSARFAPGTGEMWVKTGLGLLRQFSGDA